MPAELQATLLARAGGNPLYAEEFVRMADERGLDRLELPETVGIIAARLDDLPAAEKSSAGRGRGRQGLLARCRGGDRRP